VTNAAPPTTTDPSGLERKVLVLPDGERLAASVATRLVTRLVDLQAEKGTASVVLTGGRTGIAVLEQLRTNRFRDAIDWSNVDVFWGDERFLPVDHPDRNERQAREALLDYLPLDPHRVRAMAPAGGPSGDDAEAAAADYRALLLARSGDPDGAPLFDVCLLGVGEEGHVASIFPESPAVQESEQLAVAVHGCPKPPPTRISLTLPAIRRSSEVWLMTTGAGKAEAVTAALAGAPESDLPAAGARGLDRTLWFLDTAAAGGLSQR
jgi:6-phosphogluconolactonase